MSQTDTRSKSDVMDNDLRTVLLVSDCAADAILIRKALAMSVDKEWTLQQVNRISDGWWATNCFSQ